MSAIADARLRPVRWRLPAQASARRRAVAMAGLCAALAIWYLSWLLQGQRIGNPVLFWLLIAAEAFNLTQALGFWWTCANQRLRGGSAPADASARVDVMIPTFDEPPEIVEPTVAAACAMHGARVKVWVLDDGGREEIRSVAERHGASYLTRPDRRGAKAGNLNHALGRSDAPFVVVLDCDHVPHANFLTRTLGHLEDPEVGFVQTPQYYANAGRSAICAAAAGQQNLFFGPIARGKDGMDAMFCCGTNVVFRRTALEQAGGFPERSLTEDFELSVRVHERGFRSVYLSEVVASGLGPEDMASYVSQQQRWARGCLSAIPTVLRARLPIRTRIQYLLSATYFLSGWTLLLYMALPVVRLLFGIQPLARITADQFLLHFAPYYCGALAAVALAGSGSYTFGAFALQACNFWIHVWASVSAVLRRSARFVVTPKRGSRTRQPRAVLPALATIAALVAAGVYGLIRSRSPASLNNVAFAALHATVLSIGVMPALRIARSSVLVPDPPARTSKPARRWPRPVFLSILGATLLIPVGLGLIGARGLKAPVTLGQQAHSAAESFMSRYVTADGQVLRRDQGGDTVSEGQAYAMLVAVALDDQARFASVWGWTRAHLERPDHLLAGRWAGGRVVDSRPASDADLDAARALVLASRRFGVAAYKRDGTAIGRSILDRETVSYSGQAVLVAGPWARTTPAVVNPSYFSPRAYADIDSADHDPRWSQLEASSRTITERLTADGRSLPPDWAAVSGNGASSARPIGNPGQPWGGGAAPASSFDAMRVPIRMAESCVPGDRRLAASLWPRYRYAPGRGAYSLTGSPAVSWSHPASLVAAAAAARAAGNAHALSSLLGRADVLQGSQPSYYGAAWLALGRVMLTSTALGGCSS